MSEDQTNAWQRTREEVEAMGEELEAEGWDVVTLFADHATALGPGQDHVDPYGLVYTVPDPEAERLGDLFEGVETVQWEVFRSAGGNTAFLVTRLLAPDAEVAALLAGGIDVGDLQGIRRHALDVGAIYSHVRTIDGSVVRAFEHDDPEPFFPD